MKHLSLTLAVLLTATTATAQTAAHAKADDLKEVEKPAWNATAEAGALLTTGNSSNVTISGSTKISHVTKETKLELTVTGALARNGVLTVVDEGNDKIISSENEIETEFKTTAQAWGTRARFDKFLHKDNSLWVAALAGGDKPAGKDLTAGAQLGYARYLKKTKKTEAVVEGGYDFSYENLVGTGDNTEVAIHSARIFAGIKSNVGDAGYDASIEALTNLNPLETPTGHADVGSDLRVNAQVGVTAKLTKDTSINVSVAVKFDNVPAPLAAFPGFTYADDLVLEANKFDTTTKATLIMALF